MTYITEAVLEVDLFNLAPIHLHPYNCGSNISVDAVMVTTKAVLNSDAIRRMALE